MPASHTRGASHRLSRPAFENLQRTKPRGMMRGRAATAYGDLKALPANMSKRMELLTKEIRGKLEQNARVNAAHIAKNGHTEDFEPVVKFFQSGRSRDVADNRAA